jgi:hypothetical protein
MHTCNRTRWMGVLIRRKVTLGMLTCRFRLGRHQVVMQGALYLISVGIENATNMSLEVPSAPVLWREVQVIFTGSSACSTCRIAIYVSSLSWLGLYPGRSGPLNFIHKCRPSSLIPRLLLSISAQLLPDQLINKHSIVG